MVFSINSISFAAPESALCCEGCGHPPDEAVMYPGYGKDDFGCWGVMLTCSECIDPNISPFFMCRICTAALFRKNRCHMVSHSDLRRHSKKDTHVQALTAYLERVAGQTSICSERSNNIPDNRIHVDDANNNATEGNGLEYLAVESSIATMPNYNSMTGNLHDQSDEDEFPMDDGNVTMGDDFQSNNAPSQEQTSNKVDSNRPMHENTTEGRYHADPVVESSTAILGPNNNSTIGHHHDQSAGDEFPMNGANVTMQDHSQNDESSQEQDDNNTNDQDFIGSNTLLPSVSQQKSAWLQRLHLNASNENVIFHDYFPYDSRIHYYEHESLGNGGGAKALVGNAFYGPNVPIHGLTALYGLLFCRLAMKLPEQEARLLSHLLHFIRSPPKAVQSNGVFRDIVVPTSPSDLRSIFLKGKKSIQTCLPTLPIQQVGSHIYVSPIDCVRDLMGMGRSVEPLFAGGTVHSRSPRGIQLLRSSYVWPAGTLGNKSHQPDFFVLPMYPWNDDIDPNNVKGNRHKVWVYLITFAIPERSIHRSSNTYIVAMGPGDEDHTEVERRIRDDFVTLSSGYNFYFCPFQGPVRCVSLVYAHLADRPAKAASTCTLSGNSPLHSRFGYSGLLPGNLPSCEACHKKRKENTKNAAVVCTNCHDWSFDKLTYSRPSPFPPALSEPFLNVKPITFESMKSAMSNLFENVRNGNWKSRKESQMFSKTEGLPISVSDLIFDLAKSHLASDEHMVHLPPIAIPPTWDHPLVEMEDWITAIMHQIFLGVVKASFGDLMKDFLTTRKQFSSFVSRANRVLGPLKDLRLSWLKVEPLSLDGKFGRFVSENYLAFARLCKWLYADVDSFPATDSNYEDPKDKDLGDYNKKELGAWLQARGIQYQSRSNKRELLEKIEQAIELCSGSWPPVKWFERQTSPPELAEELVASLLAMINRVMAKGDVSAAQADDTDRHIRLFLTFVHRFDTNRETEQQTNSTSTPIWISKYNFVTLLSIPSCQQKHGSLRLLWEGDGKGEGALPKIKSAIKSLKGRWAFHATKRWYESRVLDRVTMQLVESLNQNNGDDDMRGLHNDQLLVAANTLFSTTVSSGNQDIDEMDEDKIATNDFHVYKDMEEACHLLQKSTSALSVIGYLAPSGVISFGFVFKERHSGLSETVYKVLPIHLDHTMPYTTCGAAYFKWEVKVENTFEMPDDPNFVNVFGVLLPNHINTAGDRFFYLITSDWEEMKQDQSVGKPSALGCTYNTT